MESANFGIFVQTLIIDRRIEVTPFPPCKTAPNGARNRFPDCKIPDHQGKAYWRWTQRPRKVPGVLAPAPETTSHAVNQPFGGVWPQTGLPSDESYLAALRRAPNRPVPIQAFGLFSDSVWPMGQAFFDAPSQSAAAPSDTWA